MNKGLECPSQGTWNAISIFLRSSPTPWHVSSVEHTSGSLTWREFATIPVRKKEEPWGFLTASHLCLSTLASGLSILPLRTENAQQLFTVMTHPIVQAVQVLNKPRAHQEKGPLSGSHKMESPQPLTNGLPSLVGGNLFTRHRMSMTPDPIPSASAILKQAEPWETT